jgi:hypothetical protein
VEYCFRVVASGYDIIYVPDSIIYHKVSASTHQGSALSQYYSVRNKYLFIRMHFKMFRKVSAYLCCTVQFLVRCIKKKQNFKYYICGIKAFFRNETGKVEKIRENEH